MNTNNAQLEWQNNQPYSSLYGDVYFSSDSGLAETQYVFLQHNHLEQRWKNLNADIFTIAETGFGTGLNFLCAWDLWNKVAPKNATMHFISTEMHPISLADLEKALSLWPELASLSQSLTEQYHDLFPGWHRFEFDQSRVVLTLLVGDVNRTLPELNAKVDAWFLDGFSPAKNPDMWLQPLFQNIANLSKKDATFATFTSASVVRKGLESVGFVVSKTSGFGKKREMLSGCFSSAAQVNSSINKERHAIIVGGGLAGASTAQAMAKRGWKVTLIERHEALAQEASGNPLGVLYPRINAGDSQLNQMAAQGFLHTLRMLKRIPIKEESIHYCGVLQLSFNQREKSRIESVLASNNPFACEVDAVKASELAGTPLNVGGMFIPKGAYLNPAALCHALTRHKNITIQTSNCVLNLKRENEEWQVWNETMVVARSPVVILASANDTMLFEQTAHCRLQPVRGQISLLPATSSSASIKTVICTDGYLTPANSGYHCLGATFSPNDCAIDVRKQDHQINLEMLKHLAPAIDTYTPDQLEGRAAIRCTTSDYLPMAGLILDAQALKQQPPRPNSSSAQLKKMDGLYINAGHGAKGLVNAPICAEIVASLINGDPLPVSKSLAGALNPNRFLLREMGLKKLATSLIEPS